MASWDFALLSLQMDLQLYFAVYIYSDLTIINNDLIELFWNIKQRGEGMSEVDKKEVAERLGLDGLSDLEISQMIFKMILIKSGRERELTSS